ncbi:MAG: GlsB/YeaQ/YmgE family stress response membrane protein [Chloroflexi bacterium]|nr:GlsB/YeaQ/YmgE family stress response membrane protein [Chloroflexota bacterium]
MHLDPGGLIAWLVVGLVAGWLAGQFMRGGGYGIIGDIVLGVIGAFVGGFVFSLNMPGASVGLIGSIVVAFIGAVILIALARAFTGSRAAAYAWKYLWRLPRKNTDEEVGKSILPTSCVVVRHASLRGMTGPVERCARPACYARQATSLKISCGRGRRRFRGAPLRGRTRDAEVGIPIPARQYVRWNVVCILSVRATSPH